MFRLLARQGIIAKRFIDLDETGERNDLAHAHLEFLAKFQLVDAICPGGGIIIVAECNRRQPAISAFFNVQQQRWLRDAAARLPGQRHTLGQQAKRFLRLAQPAQRLPLHHIAERHTSRVDCLLCHLQDRNGALQCLLMAPYRDMEGGDKADQNAIEADFCRQIAGLIRRGQSVKLCVSVGASRLRRQREHFDGFGSETSEPVKFTQRQRALFHQRRR